MAGEALGHVLDPRSGRPAPAWGSVTVIARDAVLADAAATALFVLGPVEGYRWAGRRGDLDALFLIERDGLLERRATGTLGRVPESRDTSAHTGRSR